MCGKNNNKSEKRQKLEKEDEFRKRILNITTIDDFNQACAEGRASDMIGVSEALQERKVIEIANDIAARRQANGQVKLVLVAGPSSSGKTTFSKRLRIQLMTQGLHPLTLSTDDYFVNREATPLDEQGKYDFESLYALDLPFLGEQLEAFLAGHVVQMPSYDFVQGQRTFKGNTLHPTKDSILIMEGIHALNPLLLPSLSPEAQYKIYVSPLTRVTLRADMSLSRRDNRLLRRIVRDYKYRGSSAQDTIARWPSVCAGEEKWIFPFEQEADSLFDSSLLFEWAILKRYVTPLLQQVPLSSAERAEADRLLSCLAVISPLHDEDLPLTSLLREFVGGSSFHY